MRAGSLDVVAIRGRVLKIRIAGPPGARIAKVVPIKVPGLRLLSPTHFAAMCYCACNASPANFWKAMDNAKPRDIVRKNIVLDINKILAGNFDRLLSSEEFPECHKTLCSRFDK